MDWDTLSRRIGQVPLTNGRRIIAIAGAPASGKSTFASSLAQRIPASCIVPMDGFHRSNDDLRAHGLLDRKGAPQTFDVAGFLDVLRRIKSQSDVTVPTFERTRDAVIPDGMHIRPEHRTILVEGNYLLLDQSPWRTLHPLWDLSIFIDVNTEILRTRLIQRWLDHDHTPDQAQARAAHNDLPNAQLIAASSIPADVVLNTAP